jgi:hypothetical protein
VRRSIRDLSGPTRTRVFAAIADAGPVAGCGLDVDFDVVRGD